MFKIFIRNFIKRKINQCQNLVVTFFLILGILFLTCSLESKTNFSNHMIKNIVFINNFYNYSGLKNDITNYTISTLNNTNENCLKLNASICSADTSQSLSADQRKNAIQFLKNLNKLNLDFSWPIRDAVLFRSFDLSPEQLHEGIALAAPVGAKILSAQSGEIVYTGDTKTRYGKIVIIKHPDNLLTIYAHLNDIFVRKNQHIKHRELIGTVGISGGLDSPRLYFQVRKNKIPIDPELILVLP